MRNLKKFLAVAVVIAMMVTAMVPAFAASTSYSFETEANTLHDLGLYSGTSTDTFTPDLGASLTREQAVTLVAALFNKSADASALTDDQVTAALKDFKDASKITWSKKFVAWAVINKISSGYANGNWGPQDKVTGQQLATFILQQLGLYDGNYATATTDLAKIENSGLSEDDAATFNTKQLTRDDAVGILYGSLTVKAKDATKSLIETIVGDNADLLKIAQDAGLVAAVKELSATAAATSVKQFTVTFNQPIDTTKFAVVVKRDMATLSVASVTYSDDKTTATVNMAAKLIAGDYTLTVSGLTDTPLTLTVAGIQDETPKQIEILSDTAASVKDTYGNIVKATVSYKVYNQYGDDITKDGATEDISWNITKGQTPTDDNDGVVTMTVSGTNYYNYGESLILTGVMNKAGIVVSKTLTVGMPSSLSTITFDKVYNADGKTLDSSTITDNVFYLLIKSAQDQYGNDISKDDLNGNLYVNSSSPNVASLYDTDAPIFANVGPNSDQLGIRLTSGAAQTDGTTTIRLISKTTGKTFSYDLTVAKKSTVASITLSQPTSVVAAKETGVEVPFTALDQNGNTITDYDELHSDVTFTSCTLTKDYVKGVGVLKFDAPGTSGTVTLLAMVNNNGKSSQITVNVKDQAQPKVITSLTSDVVPGVAVNASFDVKYTYINVHDQYDRSYDLSDTGNAAKSLGHFETTWGVPQTNDTRIIVVHDNTSDSFTQVSGSNWISGTTGDAVYAIYKKDDNDKVTIKGLNQGVSAVDFILQKYDATQPTGGTYHDGWITVAGSTYTLNVNVTKKANVSTYQVADVATVYDVAALNTTAGFVYTDYEPGITVYGIKADGSKVTMATSDFQVTSDNSAVTWDQTNNHLIASGLSYDTDKSTKTVTLIVTVYADGQPQVITKTVNVCKDAPSVSSFALDTGYDTTYDSGVSVYTYEAKYESAGLISIGLPDASVMDQIYYNGTYGTYSTISQIVRDAVKATDQYGQRIHAGDLNNAGGYSSTVLISNLQSNDGSTTPDKVSIKGYNGATTTLLDHGSSFNVVIISNGQQFSFKVKVR